MWVKFILYFVSVESGGNDLQGPVFIHEPPHRVEFSNSNGGKVDCTAHGSPPPEVEWILGDGTTVYQVIPIIINHNIFSLKKGTGFLYVLRLSLNENLSFMWFILVTIT